MNLHPPIFLVVTLILVTSAFWACRKEDPLAPQLEKLAQARKETVPEERIVLGEKSKPKRREIELLVNIIARILVRTVAKRPAGGYSATG